MSEAPKFKTFRDLRSLPVSSKNAASNSSTTSISSRTSNTDNTSSTSLPSRTKTKGITVSKTESNFKSSEISPTKDFQKIPNSVPRNLEMFRGKSKQVWDYLWHVSRGSINPVRKIRKSRKEIKEGAALGSLVTVDAAIEHLINVRLLKVNQSIGSFWGNEYEIFTPEEASLAAETSTSRASIASIASLTQNVDVLDVLGSSISSITQTQENRDTYNFSKTSFKDNIKTDDEGAVALFSDFIEKFQAAATKLTGAQLSKYEREKWGRLADLLILELETASRRASNPVSSIPAFLTKVLSSKLLNQKPIETVSKSKSAAKPDTVGKHYPESGGDDDEMKPLNDESKEAAVCFLQEFKDDAEFLNGYKKWYTEEDWNWIIKQLEINK